MPARGDRITKRKDGLFQGMYTAQTPNGPTRKYIYGRRYKEVEGGLAEAMGDAAKGIYLDDENTSVPNYGVVSTSHCCPRNVPSMCSSFQ